ncbi:hypothetical protein GCM10011412_10540 [Maribacter cobaltidurans]|nr:hypothetical protein GCM10011412_10540 [Maribacter cobaltidurans]
MGTTFNLLSNTGGGGGGGMFASELYDGTESTSLFLLSLHENKRVTEKNNITSKFLLFIFMILKY